eukprot:4614154-Amphidinium_carterae.1
MAFYGPGLSMSKSFADKLEQVGQDQTRLLDLLCELRAYQRMDAAEEYLLKYNLSEIRTCVKQVPLCNHLFQETMLRQLQDVDPEYLVIAVHGQQDLQGFRCFHKEGDTVMTWQELANVLEAHLRRSKCRLKLL